MSVQRGKRAGGGSLEWRREILSPPGAAAGDGEGTQTGPVYCVFQTLKHHLLSFVEYCLFKSTVVVYLCKSSALVAQNGLLAL